MADSDKLPNVRNAQLVNLAQTTLAINGNNMAGEDSRKAFDVLQQVCCLILLDNLRDYEYTHFTEPSHEERMGTEPGPPTKMSQQRKK